MEPYMRIHLCTPPLGRPQSAMAPSPPSYHAQDDSHAVHRAPGTDDRHPAKYLPGLPPRTAILLTPIHPLQAILLAGALPLVSRRAVLRSRVCAQPRSPMEELRLVAPGGWIDVELRRAHLGAGRLRASVWAVSSVSRSHCACGLSRHAARHLHSRIRECVGARRRRLGEHARRSRAGRRDRVARGCGGMAGIL